MMWVALADLADSLREQAAPGFPGYLCDAASGFAIGGCDKSAPAALTAPVSA